LRLVQYRDPTNIRRYYTKYGGRGDVAPGIYAPLNHKVITYKD